MLIAAAVVASLPSQLGTNALAAACLALALVLDTADGHLARLQGTATPFGRWLDAFLDELADLALHGATAWACFARGGQPAWLLLGMAYIGGKYLFVFGNTTWAADGARPTGASPSPATANAPALRSFAHALGHADLRWHLWIVLALAGRLDVALWLYTAYFPARAAAGAIRKWRSSRA
jgi:phosphatidylglycerophosphate synthase